MVDFAEPLLVGRRVLVADDSAPVAELVRDVLVADGAEVDIVSGGRQALQALQAHGYDLLVLDLLMPRPDGWDVLEALQQSQPSMLARVLLLTGDRYRTAGIAHEPFASLPTLFKPFHLADLRGAVGDLLAARAV